MGLAESIKIRVVHETADIFLKPDLKSTILRTVNAGAILDAEEKVGEWFRVVLPPDDRGFSLTGYVHISLVEVETPEVEVKPEKPSPPPRKEILDSDPLLPKSPGERNRLKLGFRISGGLGFPRVGDLNSVLNRNETYYYPPGTSFEGEIDEVRTAMEFDAEILIHITEHFGLTLGAGYISAKNPEDKSSLTATWGIYREVLTDEMKMSAVPVRLGLFFSLPVSSFLRFTLSGGGGLYLARCSEIFSMETSPYDRYAIDEWEAKKMGLGFQGGLGLELDVTGNIGFVLEAIGRYARFDGFSGTYDYEADGIMRVYIPGLEPHEEGDLYYFEQRIFTSEWYPVLLIRGSEPGNASFPSRNVRLAVVDFSGISLKFGLKFTF